MFKKYKKFNVACVQMNSQDNLDSNILFIKKKILKASKKRADLVILPENCFFMGKNDINYIKYSFNEKNHPGIVALQEISKKLNLWIIIGSVNVKEKKNIFNRSILINNYGKIVGRYDKIHLFSANLPDGKIYNEAKYFKSGKNICLKKLPWGKIGLTICYDLRFSYLYRKLALKGALFITVPSAFTEFTGKLHWHTLLKSRAIETGCYIFAPAQCGNHPGNRKTYGHSLIIDPWGKIINESMKENEIIISKIDPHKVLKVRSSIPSLKINKKI